MTTIRQYEEQSHWKAAISYPDAIQIEAGEKVETFQPALFLQGQNGGTALFDALSALEVLDFLRESEEQLKRLAGEEEAS